MNVVVHRTFDDSSVFRVGNMCAQCLRMNLGAMSSFYGGSDQNAFSLAHTYT